MPTWLADLIVVGAVIVAVYVLGLLSRNTPTTARDWWPLTPPRKRNRR